MKNGKTHFVCKCCKKEQNLDQSVHINKNYCVSCYSKEQLHREATEKISKYITYLKEKDKYSIIIKNKVKKIIKLTEVLLPLTIFQLEDGEIRNELKEKQRNALKTGLHLIAKKYDISVNENAITYEIVKKLNPVLKYKQKTPKDKLNLLFSILEPFVDKEVKKKRQFFKDLKKNSTTDYFTFADGNYKLGKISPFEMNVEYYINLVSIYRKRINKRSSQREQFKRFLRKIANDSQFQTIDDLLKISIENYVIKNSEKEIELLKERMMEEIIQEEEADLIPNIAKHILNNHERIFQTWFTKILPFDKSRFMASRAKTGSRTDFIIRLQYNFRSYELRWLKEELANSTELMIKEKAKHKIEKINENKKYSAEKKKEKIEKEKSRLEKRLEPEKLKQMSQQNAEGAQMVARYLLINAEKAFNIVLNKIIQFHYKRLYITTPVQYITNVLESGAEEKNADLKAFYLIHSREW